MPDKPNPSPKPAKPTGKIVGNDGNIFRCPLCKTALPNSDVASFPFCSDRCRLIDLNNWIDGKYTVTRPIDPTDHLDDMPKR